MNETVSLIHQRKSIRAYQPDKPLDRETVDMIIQAAMRAPTAGNMMLYSIIEIADPALKDQLAESCDHQPFIAKAPLLLLFAADYQRWYDFFVASEVPAYCAAQGQPLRCPGEGDLILACEDALIAAQTAVIAAESLGIGSCYIGDILERYEYHKQLLHLPQYVFPVALVCFGYPNASAANRPLTPRLPQSAIHFTNSYQRLDRDTLLQLWPASPTEHYINGAANHGQNVYARKFGADFSVEMTRSVRAAIAAWSATPAAEEPPSSHS